MSLSFCYIRIVDTRGITFIIYLYHVLLNLHHSRHLLLAIMYIVSLYFHFVIQSLFRKPYKKLCNLPITCTHEFCYSPFILAISLVSWKFKIILIILFILILQICTFWTNLLTIVQKRSEDLARASVERIEVGSNISSSTTSGSKVNSTMLPQLSAPNTGTSVDDYDTFVVVLNIVCFCMFINFSISFVPVMFEGKLKVVGVLMLLH